MPTTLSLILLPCCRARIEETFFRYDLRVSISFSHIPLSFLRGYDIFQQSFENPGDLQTFSSARSDSVSTGHGQFIYLLLDAELAR